MPSVRKVPGVISATRLQSAPLTLRVGGEVLTVEAAGEQPVDVAVGRVVDPGMGAFAERGFEADFRHGKKWAN